jgi:alpha-N-arabinofuranosidase
MLVQARVPDMKYENADGSPIRIDKDYFGNARNASNPFPGPFEGLKAGKQLIRV